MYYLVHSISSTSIDLWKFSQKFSSCEHSEYLDNASVFQVTRVMLGRPFIFNFLQL